MEEQNLPEDVNQMPTLPEIISLKEELRNTTDIEIVKSIEQRALSYKAVYDENLKNIKGTDLFSVSAFGNIILILKETQRRLSA